MLKVERHTQSTRSSFAMPDYLFDHVYMDIAGHLPELSAFMYLPMCIDQFFRWQDAFLIRGMTTKTVAKAFVEYWVAICGAPSTKTAD